MRKKLLKSSKLTRLALSKKALLNKKVVPAPKPAHETPISHIEPFRIIKPFYQGSKIQVQKGIMYTCFENCVLYGDRKIQHNSEEIGNFCVSNNGEHIATFTRNYMVRYCRLEEAHEVLFTMKVEPLFAIDMAFSPEDVFVALGGSNCMVKIVNVKKNNVASEFRVSGSVVRLAWVPIMRKLQLAIASDDRKVSLFDLVTNRIVGTFRDFQSRITGLHFNEHILVSSADKHVKVWDTSVLKQSDSYEVPLDIEALICVDGVTLMGALTGEVMMYHKGNLSVDEQLCGQEILKFIYDQGKLYIVTSELHVYHCRLEGGMLIVEQCLLGYNDEVLHVRFMPNNQLLMATNSPFMKLIDLNTMEVIAWKAHYSVIMCCEYVDGLIVTGSKDNCVSIFKHNGFKIPVQLFKYTGHSDDVVSIDVTKRHVVSVSNDHTIKIWDLLNYTSEQSLKTAIAHEKEINCVRYSPNGKLIATASHDRSIKIWDENLMMTNKLMGHKRGVWDVQFSPVEKLLASSSGDNTVKIWNLSDGSIIKSFQGTSPILKVLWLCRGQQLITGDAVGNIKLWSVKKQTCLNTFSQHDGKIYALDVKREGTQLYFATGANDSLCVIWKDATVEVGQQQQQQQHESKIKMQDFQNLMRDQSYCQAAYLAYQNNFTKHFIEAATELMKLDQLEELAKLMGDDPIKYLTLLNTLNMSKKTCPLAQSLFYNTIRQVKLSLDNKEVIKKLIQQFKYTTQKYYERMDNHYKQTFLIKYMIDKHKLIV